MVCQPSNQPHKHSGGYSQQDQQVPPTHNRLRQVTAHSAENVDSIAKMLFAFLSWLTNRKKKILCEQKFRLQSPFPESKLGMGLKSNPSTPVNQEFLQRIRHLRSVYPRNTCRGCGTMDWWMISTWISWVPSLFPSALVTLAATDSCWKVLTRSVWGCATSGSTCEKFMLSESAGRNFGAWLKAGKLSWQTRGTHIAPGRRPGRHQELSQNMKPPGDFWFAWAYSQSKGSYWLPRQPPRMNSVLTLLLESPKHHKQRDISRKGLRISKF